LWEHQEPSFDVVGWTLKIAGVERGMRVLDVGCGNGRYLRAMRLLGLEAIGCDLSPGMLSAASDSAVVVADAVRLPFCTGAFDVVLAAHMLYHVADRVSAAHELRRVLSPEGACVAVANGAGHLASLRSVVEEAAQPLRPGWRWIDPLSAAFSLQNGADQLAVAFEEVRCILPERAGRAVVTDPDVVAGYVASVGDVYGHELPGSWDRVVDGVRARAALAIERDGAFPVEGQVGAFVCR
jgi:SAM-dependent methyltransferase